MRGIDAQTGRPIAGVAHLRQSVRDILTTPLGSRVMRRTYGSTLFSMTDAPGNAETIARIAAATARALDAFEPRFRPRRVRVTAVGEGRISLDVDGDVVPEGVPLTIAGVTV